MASVEFIKAAGFKFKLEDVKMYAYFPSDYAWSNEQFLSMAFGLLMARLKQNTDMN